MKDFVCVVIDDGVVYGYHLNASSISDAEKAIRNDHDEVIGIFELSYFSDPTFVKFMNTFVRSGTRLAKAKSRLPGAVLNNNGSDQ